ncbi:LOW QUALITY PROTEIN: sterile alpha motif domain-containing protein 9-like [Gouania willdenowi]|uniref:LOW QUALITY PROTEIN: sterile alpha motif domain-containing protein 9-like n=1 Tax=Gouania willdenowi TaxID=441366 RepID=UPI0010560F80|nr:LOW QUALITY PROTEIN: sterile alpha motif domain-containing protein 9-like [Gouania willdenowi]
MESGPSNIIEPCHEFKAFTKTTDETKMKFTDETIRFAAACMNSRTNGTIHFGIGDTTGFKHGQVLGVDVEDKEDFANKLEKAIEVHFEHKYVKDAKKCIRHPRFVGVLSRNMTSSTKYVIEVDIVPDSLICKENYYHTNTHDMTTKKAKKKINETENSQPSKQFFVREGGSTVNLLTQTPEDKKEKRYQDVLNGISEVSELRKHAEEEHLSRVKSSTQGHLLANMITGGSLSMDKSHFEHYVVVTNKSHPSQLESLAFLVDLNPVAVLDFDPESDRGGPTESSESVNSCPMYIFQKV